MISYQTENVKMPAIPKRMVSTWIKDVAKLHKFKVGEVGYTFCDDPKILEINNQYLHHDYYTDIITFDYTEEGIINGDIFISLDTVKSNAEQFNVSCNEELLRIIIHGILHLCGQEDKAPEDHKEMTRQENEALEMRSLELKKKTKEVPYFVK
jgi:probable rRNA maturation factor